MFKFDDGSHCHWSYKVGRYESFLNWPTEAEAREALGNRAGKVIARHGNRCACAATND